MRARRTDSNHRAVAEAIRKLGCPVKSLHTQGGGVEDLLVGIEYESHTFMGRQRAWLLVEIKRIERESTGYYRHTPAQKAWYAASKGFPRLVVTSAQDAIDQIRRLTG